MNPHGGKRDIGEDIQQTAQRELFEETGASKYELVKIAPYLLIEKQNGITVDERYGMLYYAEILEFGKKPECEIERIYLTEDIPMELTYEEIQYELMNKVIGVLKDGKEYI
jgi:hydrolase, NUDIX family